MAKLQSCCWYEPAVDVSQQCDTCLPVNGPRDLGVELMLNCGRAVVQSSRRCCTNQLVELPRAWVGARPTAARLINLKELVEGFRRTAASETR